MEKGRVTEEPTAIGRNGWRERLVVCYTGQLFECPMLPAEKGFAMQWVKIQIPDKSESAKAMMAMARRGRIDCYADDVYMVPEPALELLKELGVTYQELGRGGFDYAQKTLRDTLAAHPQRRSSGQSREVLSDA
jgi:hypothetical protein